MSMEQIPHLEARVASLEAEASFRYWICDATVCEQQNELDLQPLHPSN